MQKQIITNSFEETQEFGLSLAEKVQDMQVLALHGNLGSGKTTFMQGLAHGLGIEKKIISPTFIIMRTYHVGIKQQKSGIKELYHIDLYRISSEEDVEGVGLLELMGDPETIVAIEWPDKIENLLPENS